MYKLIHEHCEMIFNDLSELSGPYLSFIRLGVDGKEFVT